MGANLFHNLRIVAGQMAYPVLRSLMAAASPRRAAASVILASMFCSRVES
jgi:hypothetical protein